MTKHTDLRRYFKFILDFVKSPQNFRQTGHRIIDRIQTNQCIPAAVTEAFK